MSLFQERKHNPGNVAYTALVCGYAELGQMENVERVSCCMCVCGCVCELNIVTQVLIEMRQRKLFPSLMVYINLMNSLSERGHTHLINKVLEHCVMLH